MRFMFLVTSAKPGSMPPRKLMDEMEIARQESERLGEMVMTGGLAPAMQSARARVAGGRLTVTDGPFAEGKELVGGFAIMELPSREEAVKRGRWLMEMHLKYWPGWEGEVDVRPMYDAADAAANH